LNPNYPHVGIAPGKVSKPGKRTIASDDRTGVCRKAALERRTINIPDLGNQPTNSLSAPRSPAGEISNYYAVPVMPKDKFKEFWKSTIARYCSQ